MRTYKMITLLFLIVLFAGVGWVLAIPRPNINRTTVHKFDLQCYLGVWYEIARFDHRFERGLKDVSAEYTLPNRGKGRIAVKNSGTNCINDKIKVARGIAKQTTTVGKLKVSFFRPFWADYNVLELADDYSWALVGSRSADYLWILSRSRSLPQKSLEHILHLARLRGYDTSKLIFNSSL